MKDQPLRILFVGTGAIGIPSLRALAADPSIQLCGVVTQPDKPAGRQMLPAPPPIKTEALRLQLPVYQPEKIKAPTSLAQFRYLQADLFVVVAYGQILSKEVLDTPALGCLNIHASLLPKHRGASPIHSAILSGDKETGITIMWMDEGLDTGDICVVKKTPIRRRDTAGILHDRLAEIAPEALSAALHLIRQKRAPKIPQDATQASYAKKLVREDGLLDWTLPQVELDRRIRGLNPWPCAHTTIELGQGPKLLKVFSVIISRHCKGRPGEITRVDRHGILVAAGVGGLLLREVQMEGKKRMKASDFANGVQLEPGKFLGSPAA